MKPLISEFSYGYALTEEIVSICRARIIGSPVFPSLYKEGKVGGGYDVGIPLRGRPVFLQFKLSECLTRLSAKECRSGLLSIPYYRMHLRPLKHSSQHNLLLELERKGETVFYVAPEFHTSQELNEQYLARSIVTRPAAFSPLDIGDLPDQHEHYIVFEKGSTYGYRCSDNPSPIRRVDIASRLIDIAEGEGRALMALGDAGFQALAEKMVTIIEEVGLAEGFTSSARTDGSEAVKISEEEVDYRMLWRIVESREPSESVSYLARTFFDSELIVVER